MNEGWIGANLKIKLQEANHMIVRGPRHFDFLNQNTHTLGAHTNAGYCYTVE